MLPRGAVIGVIHVGPMGASAAVHARNPEPARVVPPVHEPDDRERLTWRLAFEGPSPAVTAELAFRTTAALRGVRLAWTAFWLVVTLIALITSPPSVQPSLAGSVGATVLMIAALLLRPSWGSGVSTLTASLLIAALDSRLTTELLAPGSSVAADEEVMSPLAFMPVVHTALLSPSWGPMVRVEAVLAPPATRVCVRVLDSWSALMLSAHMSRIPSCARACVRVCLHVILCALFVAWAAAAICGPHAVCRA